MVFYRGLSVFDLFFFKQIFQKKRSNIYNTNLIKKKILICRKNFFTRRTVLLKMLSQQNYFKLNHQPIFKLNIHGKKIYENGGIYIFATQSLIFFKILRKKIKLVFLIKKIKFFLNEKFKMKRNLICIFDRMDLLTSSCREILGNCIKKSNQGILFVLISEKVRCDIKQLSLKLSKYYKRNLENNNFKYYLTFKHHSKNLNRKLLLFYKYTFSSIVSCLEDKIYKCFLIFKTNSKFLFFVNFLACKSFHCNKKIRLEQVNTLVQNSILTDYNQTYINHVIDIQVIWNLNVTKKKYQKQKYIEITLMILIGMKE